MNLLNLAIGIIAFVIAIVGTILTAGLLAPFMLPVAYFGLTRLGVKTE